MPTIFEINGYRFYFFMNEHEPIHIHVAKASGKAKIILVPDIKIIKASNFKPRELKQIVEIVILNYELLINKWNETFNK